MNRRQFFGYAVPATLCLPLMGSVHSSESKDDEDLIVFREIPSGREQIEFEYLRVGDIAVFVSPTTGPHDGRWKICSKPTPFTLENGRRTWRVMVDKVAT